MSKQKEKTGLSGMPVTGLSALLVIFAVLCLTVFAVLSIATVNADQRLADRMVNQAAAYYQADCKAEETLALLRQGVVPEYVTETGADEEGRRIFEYTCPLSDTQAIKVRTAVSEGDYEILQWQLVSAVDWEADEGLSLWDGE